MYKFDAITFIIIAKICAIIYIVTATIYIATAIIYTIAAKWNFIIVIFSSRNQFFCFIHKTLSNFFLRAL